MSWQNQSSRCKTGIHEFVSANKIVQCTDDTKPNIISETPQIPVFSVMLYGGAQASNITWPFHEGYNVNTPMASALYADTGSVGIAKDWYIMDTSLNEATNPAVVPSGYPEISVPLWGPTPLVYIMYYPQNIN